jgi:hypothetical protein
LHSYPVSETQKTLASMCSSRGGTKIFGERDKITEKKKLKNNNNNNNFLGVKIIIIIIFFFFFFGGGGGFHFIKIPNI